MLKETRRLECRLLSIEKPGGPMFPPARRACCSAPLAVRSLLLERGELGELGPARDKRFATGKGKRQQAKEEERGNDGSRFSREAKGASEKREDH